MHNHDLQLPHNPKLRNLGAQAEEAGDGEDCSGGTAGHPKVGSWRQSSYRRLSPT